jgi:hypothetical protein
MNHLLNRDVLRLRTAVPGNPFILGLNRVKRGIAEVF